MIASELESKENYQELELTWHSDEKSINNPVKIKSVNLFAYRRTQNRRRGL